MSYRINVRKNKNGTLSWGLVFRTVQKSEKIENRIKNSDLLQYGFRPEMTVDEARTRASQLNQETKSDRSAERRKVLALDSANKELALESKNFPPMLLKDFETKRLRSKYGLYPDFPRKKSLATYEFHGKNWDRGSLPAVQFLI